MRIMRSFVLGIVGVAVIYTSVAVLDVPGRMLLAQSPPAISDVQIASTTESGVIIRWRTDKPSIGTINYGKRSDYGIVRNPVFNAQEHEVIIEDLDPATLYHFRITASDQDGNQGISGDFIFTTETREDIEDIDRVASRDQQTLVAQATQAIRQITDPSALELVADVLEQQAEDVLRPPSIIGAARIAEIGMDYAIIQWNTNRETSSEVAYATAAEYAASGGSYTSIQGIPDSRQTEHEVRLAGLSPGTTYHFQVRANDNFGLEGTSLDNTFETRSRLPFFQNIQLLKIEEESVTLAWATDIPASGVVEFQNLDTGELRSVGSPEFLSAHTVQLSELTLGTTYVAEIRAENEQGDSIRSETITFTTVEDNEPPIISRVTNESTLFPGAEARIQTIVTWETDELATCQMFYRDGIQESIEPVALDRGRDPAQRHVQVIVEFQPATVYQFWIECTDRANNTGRTENFVLFTPAQEKSIIDIIIENFEGAFGWLRNIGG